MVSIPVGLFSAIGEKDVRFHQIHRECGSRIRLQKWCPVHERAVSADELVKGYEVSKGRYVLIEDEDIEALPVPSKHTIEVGAFVEVSEVDPIYFDSPYYLEPEEAGRKPYALLLKALEKKGVAAVAKIAMRQKESLCLLRPGENRILLETLHFPDEIREVPHAGADVKVEEKELKMAESLIDLLRDEFHPENYRDEYREALLHRIQEKAEGQEVEEQPETPGGAQIIDLFEALRKSLDAAKKEKEPVRTGGSKKAA